MSEGIDPSFMQDSKSEAKIQNLTAADGLKMFPSVAKTPQFAPDGPKKFPSAAHRTLLCVEFPRRLIIT